MTDALTAPIRAEKMARLSPKIQHQICEAIAEGAVLLDICKWKGENEEPFPSRREVIRAARRDPEFRKRLEDAELLRPEVLVEQMLSIADGDDSPPNKRVRIETRQWLLSKWMPERYGAVQQVNMDVRGEVFVTRVQCGDRELVDAVPVAALPVAEIVEPE